MFSTNRATASFSLLQVKDFVSIGLSPSALDTTSTDESDLGGIIVCHRTRRLSWFGDSVPVNISFATTDLVFLLLHHIALMQTGLYFLSLLSRKEETISQT